MPALTPSSSNIQRLAKPEQESLTHPILLVAIAVALVILSMVFNSADRGFNQPASSTEQYPLKKLTAEKSLSENFSISREAGR